MTTCTQQDISFVHDTRFLVDQGLDVAEEIDALVARWDNQYNGRLMDSEVFGPGSPNEGLSKVDITAVFAIFHDLKNWLDNVANHRRLDLEKVRMSH